jgi:hypothetical protein
MIHPMREKEKQMLTWIAQNTIVNQDACLDYTLRYGKYKGFTLEEMLGDDTRIAYIQWLKRTTNSSTLKKKITGASKAMLRQLST